MKNKVKFNSILLYVFLSATPFTSTSAAIVTSDFQFGSGTPFGGTTTLGGIEVTLTTSNTQPFGFNSFRDLLNTDPAFVTLSFSAPISEFVLTISRVLPPDEFLTDFNIGAPTSLTGDLVDIGGEITSSKPGDFGTGSLFWSGLNTTEVSFTIGNLASSTAAPALAIDEFGINAVPIPAAVWFLGSGLLSLLSFRKVGSGQKSPITVFS